MLCYATLCYAMLCYSALCCAMLCGTMLRYAILGHAMLCCASANERAVWLLPGNCLSAHGNHFVWIWYQNGSFLGSIFGTFGSFWRQFWSSWLLMPPGGFPGPSQQRVGEPPGPTGTSLGHTWALQVQIWGQLGVNWFFPHWETLFFGGQLGTKLTHLEPSWCQLGSTWTPICSSKPTWANLERTWPNLETQTSMKSKKKMQIANGPIKQMLFSIFWRFWVFQNDRFLIKKRG